jgi:U5 snRNP protein, DIM1 family
MTFVSFRFRGFVSHFGCVRYCREEKVIGVKKRRRQQRGMAELVHLRSAWDVDRFIVLESEKVVIVRFSKFEAGPSTSGLPQEHAKLLEQHHLATQYVDDILTSVAARVRKYAVVYAVDLSDVNEFNTLYELGGDEEPFALMFFFRGHHIRVDVGTGNHNKINFVMEEDDLIPIVDTVYRSGRQGKSICSSEKKFPHAAIKR